VIPIGVELLGDLRWFAAHPGAALVGLTLVVLFVGALVGLDRRDRARGRQ
jgi:hypothetical protein